VLALAVAAYFTNAIFAVDTKNGPKAVEIERLRKMINEGAISFLNTEYKFLAMFVVVMAIAVGVILIEDGDGTRGVKTALPMLVGALLSGAAGYAGMLIATNANSRTTLACVQSISEGLKVSFASGAVMANSVVGLGLFGLCIMYLALRDSDELLPGKEWSYLSGFGFGASCIALFARVGGGVFTKAADVGADLVGKVEKGIPEDDPRNPAVVADNVGDNVGDVAGMGADLFESFVGAIIATGSLATTQAQAALPFYIAGSGILASFVGTVLIRSAKLEDNATLANLLWTIRKGIFVSMALSAALSLVWCLLMFDEDTAMRLWGCTLIGLVAGEVIGAFTEYVTSYEDAPTRDISAASEYGAAPVIIKGLGVGMISVIVPTLALAIVIIACNEIAGQYGISLSAVGLLATLGVTLATDAYGPVADNAGGIAEMAGLPGHIRDRTDALDSLGNTTAATGKGFAIGSAVLTSVGLIVAFLQDSGLTGGAADLLSLSHPAVLAGTLIGAMLPFLFGALTMLSVDRSARAIITEVRLQFAQCPYLMIREGQTEEEYEADFNARKIDDINSPHDGKIKGTDGHYYPDSNRCVAIATTSAVQEMVLPGTMAVFAPVVVGYLLGGPALAGMLIGSLTSGFMLALTMSNAGGAWDNAKKWVEKCASEGEPLGEGLTYTRYGVKKTAVGTKVAATAVAQLLAEGEVAPEDEAAVTALAERLNKLYKDRHDPVVVGDTVGDPFKDTSGPALNILIKLMSVVSLVLAPTVETTTFHKDTWYIGLIVLIVVSGAVFFLQKQFHKSNTERSNAAVQAKKEADARILALGDVEEGGAGAEQSPADDAEAAAEAGEKAEETVAAEEVEVKAD
jgi:H(+)-translocating pyrophosphatase